MAPTLVVTQLFIHPLKSGAPVRVPAAPLDALGLAGDRRWMVVDRDRRFVSQREISRMALLRARLDADHLALEAPGLEPLRVPTPWPDADRRPVVVWDDTFEAVIVKGESSAWISRALGLEGGALAYCPADARRPVDPRYASDSERVSFADGFPLLVVGQASLDDLNARLEARGQAPVPMNRFRPNIVIEGADPFAEDGWRRLRIGDGPDAVEIEIVKPCARCSIVPVDQATGIRGKEPLATLNTFRNRDGKVYFGQNALHRTGGTIREGAPVRLLASPVCEAARNTHLDRERRSSDNIPAGTCGSPGIDQVRT